MRSLPPLRRRFGAALIVVLGVLGLLAAGPSLAQTRHLIVPDDQPADGQTTHHARDLNPLLQGAVRPGDEIRFAPGQYGHLEIRAPDFASPVLVSGQDQGAHLSSLKVMTGANLVLADFAVWPGPGDQKIRHVVRIEKDTSRIMVRGFDLRSAKSADSYLSWSAEEWLRHKRAGLLALGRDVHVRNNRFRGFGGAIGAVGPGAVVAGNVITGFSSDGIRVLGNNSQVVGNDIRDCIKVDDNHDDGIQSWSRGPKGRAGRGTVRGLRIAGNRIVEWTGPANALRCSLQGIGLFDGLYEGVEITNNLVVVSAFHGISIYGGRDVRITHNTVLNSRGPSGEAPWIGIFDHRRGGDYRDVIVANNVAPRFQFQAKAARSLTRSQNLVAPYPQRVFADPSKGDFRPAPGSALRDRADPKHGPGLDMAGQTRRDGPPDIGAFEAR